MSRYVIKSREQNVNCESRKGVYLGVYCTVCMFTFLNNKMLEK